MIVLIFLFLFVILTYKQPCDLEFTENYDKKLFDKKNIAAIQLQVFYSRRIG